MTFPSTGAIDSQQWLTLLDEINIGAFTIDLSRRITAMNVSARNLMGLEDIEVVGIDCLEVFCGVPCLMRCRMEDSQSAESECLEWDNLESKNRRDMVTRLSTALVDKSGRVCGCLTILQDHSRLTDLIQRLHYEERRLKMILDHLNIGIFTVDCDSNITFFNTAIETITGFQRQDVIHTPCASVFGERAAQCILKPSASRISETPCSQIRCEIRTRQEDALPVQTDYMPLQNDKGKIVGGLATVQDLTLAQQLDQVISDRYTFHHMIGKEPIMQRIFDMVRVVAPSEATVLIEGATGTGKDLLAKVIHSASRRADKPFVKINCAAIPANLLESELFGYVRGAFTGADRNKQGRFQEADGGTIFLDEIGDLPLSLQAKLLRVIEDREFYPLGSRHTAHVDIRILSATNRGLHKLVTKRRFREDLFYRLNVMRIELPPLENRRGDLPLLVRHILRRLCAVKAAPPPPISENALKVLFNYHYPGNIRELENILEHALIISQCRRIDPHHLPDYVHDRAYHTPLPAIKPSRQDGTRQKLLHCLQRHQWHRRRTAEALGIDRTTLWRQMKKFDLLRPVDEMDGSR